MHQFCQSIRMLTRNAGTGLTLVIMICIFSVWCMRLPTNCFLEKIVEVLEMDLSGCVKTTVMKH